MKFGKRQILIVSLTFVVCLAVFLNWKYSDVLTQKVPNNEKVLGETLLVDNKVPETPKTNEPEEKPEEKPEENSLKKTESEYFIKAKLNRKQTRDEAITTLKTLVDNSKSDKAVKDKASSEILSMSTAMEREGKIENLINSKGFENSLALVSSDSATIIIQKESLTDAEIVIIKDIVANETKLRASKISIIPVKTP
ncbi:MAG: SpoIIIAH-like family protein [Clostridia bacterium]